MQVLNAYIDMFFFAAESSLTSRKMEINWHESSRVWPKFDEVPRGWFELLAEL